jgi:nanoRNase/pAp phosphatase (c-di-AMP/oligoRNAs hydrolase)
MTEFDRLVALLDTSRQIVVQAHDFPDHDAVATAFALTELFKTRGITAVLSYGGTIQSDSLVDAIRQLEIAISSNGAVGIEEDAQIVVVDGFVGNSNISNTPGRTIGVIDHHPPPWPSNCAFVDIREEYGSCSTILFEYYRDNDVEMEDRVATSLLMGLMMDTAFMTRGVTPIDLDAFHTLYQRGDWQRATRLLRNSLSLGDLAAFRQAIDACIVARDFGFIVLPSEYSAEVTALVADFFLGLRELQFVVVVTGDRDEYRLSVRSEDDLKPSDAVIREALDGIGAGGGHIHMGGGSIPRDLYPGDEGLRKRFIAAIESVGAERTQRTETEEP